MIDSLLHNEISSSGFFQNIGTGMFKEKLSPAKIRVTASEPAIEN